MLDTLYNGGDKNPNFWGSVAWLVVSVGLTILGLYLLINNSILLSSEKSENQGLQITGVVAGVLLTLAFGFLSKLSFMSFQTALRRRNR